MTWKDALRKAPFDAGRAKREVLDYTAEDNKRRLKEFPKLLEELLDKNLKSEIQRTITRNPNADVVKIKIIGDLEMHLDNLLERGIKPSQLERIMEDEYNFDSVRINSNNTFITFRGFGGNVSVLGV